MKPLKLMSCEEIRYWMKELHENHGWSYGALARTLGIGLKQHAASKVRGNSSIYRREQKRMSRQLDRIISGELVPVARATSTGGCKRIDAVLADHPVSLETRMRMKFDLTIGRLVYVPRRNPSPGTVLSFARGVEAFK